MDWLEKIKQEIRDAKIITAPTKKTSSIIEESTGYYTLPCSKDPFEGEVLKLSGDEFYVFFQRYAQGTEGNFRDKLSGMDEWFFDKPYKVQKNWLEYVLKWLNKEREK